MSDECLSKTNQDPMRKRSLTELDDVIDEILNRNPDFLAQLEKIMEEKREKDG